MLGQRRFVEHGVARFNREAAPLGHGVARVHHQVRHHLLDLARVNANPGRDGLAGDGHHDVFADHPAQHRLDLAERGVEVDDLRLQHLAAAEREHLLREVGRAHGGAGNLFGIGAAFILGIERGQHDLGVADDRRQQVVEVVGDAAGETAHGLHLLRVAQLLFQQQPPLKRIVALRHDGGEELSGDRPQGKKHEQQELRELHRKGGERTDPERGDGHAKQRDRRNDRGRAPGAEAQAGPHHQREEDKRDRDIAGRKQSP